MSHSSKNNVEQLEALLAESVIGAKERERSQFERAAGVRSESIVLFGAGGLGRRTLAKLRVAGVEPLAFIDNRQELWNSELDGLIIFSPEEAAQQFGSKAAFVVTIWGAGSPHRFEHTETQLHGLGCDVVIPFPWLAWRYAEQLLPYYALDLPSHLLNEKDEVRKAFEFLDDDQSREEYVSQVKWRLTGDSSELAHPVDGVQYLVTDVASAIDDEVVVDCGAFDGDSLRDWLNERGPTFAAYFAMEPDPKSLERLGASLKEMDPKVASRIHVLPYATSGESAPITFSASGLTSAASGSGGQVVVQGKALDDLGDELLGFSPTFLKFDIEGAEFDALNGGRDLILSSRPLMTISAYHLQNHLWLILSTLKKMLPDFRYFLRPHNEEAFDLILYAVPPDRVPPAKKAEIESTNF